jgi:NodT family efflux transporter outer membrane factor (OMF) lipoprotein
MSRALLPIAAAALALSGCAVGPRFQEPPTPAAASGAFVAATPRTAALEAPPDRWWELYQDPAIDRLVQDALAHNADLRAAAANLAQARGALLAARAGQFPLTQESAGPTWGKSGTQNLVASLEGKQAKPDWYYAAQFDAAWEVDLFGRVRRAVQAARQTVEAEAAAQDFVRVSVAAETTRAYVDACAYAQEIAVAKHSVDVVARSYDITRSQVRLGSASEFDLARQGTLLEQTRALVPPLEDLRRASLYRLSVLTGQPPEQIDRAAAACTRPPARAQALPVGDGAALLRRRPDVREAERNLAAAVSRVDVAVAGLYPTITLGGSVAGAGARPGQVFTAPALSYGVGPLISWSFPNLTAQRGQIAQARAVASGALAQFDATVLSALQETETALSAYSAELDRHKALAAAQAQAELAYRLAQVRFKGGSASFLDLLTAEQALVTAEQGLANSDQLLASDQVSVFKALGGGWQNAPRPAAKSGWTP